MIDVDDALEQIDRKVLQLFALVGESVSGATHALLSGDREAAKSLADRDEVVDTLYHDIEHLTLQQLTVAGITSPKDLRFLVTVIRMLPDLERNGDLAEHVARRAARGLGGELSARSRGLVERMGEVAIHMWRATTDAYAERQPMAASVVDTLDDEMDDLHVSLTVEVVAGTMPLPVAVELAMVARFYERFGDHAVNLAKRVAVWPRQPAAGHLADRGWRIAAQPTTPSATSASAICTALSAAPLRRLSPLMNRASRLSMPSALRMRPTRVGSFPAACRGVGHVGELDPGHAGQEGGGPLGAQVPRELGHDGVGVAGEHRHPDTGAGDGQIGDAQDLAALVPEFLFLAGLVRAVPDQMAGHGDHVVGDDVGEDAERRELARLHRRR